MAGARIVCDSTADLGPSYLAAHDVRVVPLKVIFGEEVLEDGVDVDAAGFYARMRASTVHPRTSQPTPAEFEAVFAELGRAGQPVVCTTISADLSGTYASATQAREALAELDIRVIDTRTAAVGHHAIIREAARVAESGAGVAEVEAAIAGVQATQKLLFTVETLEYLRRGGRIGGARALLGSVLDIKPILELRDGVIEPVDRVRTYARALERIAAEVAKQTEAWGKAAIVVGHGGVPEVGEAMLTRMGQIANAEVVLTDVGPTIGCHAGPGAVGVGFHRPIA